MARTHIVGLALALLLPAGHLSGQHALGGSGPYDPAVPTPASILGYPLGEAFTPHHMMVRYLEHVARSSDRVRLDTVAMTHERRPVLLATVTSAANMARLEEIRAGAQRLADPRGAAGEELERLVADLPAVVWLGYTVHGPEASGVEAALATVYQLAAGQDRETLEILDQVVTLVDPVQNPDGHERHVSHVAWDLGRFGPDPHPGAAVHTHDWHGARGNHYLFDLNRDWIVHAHPETRGRMAVFRAWFPHVAADLHEMGSNSTYFFAPPMEPVHPNVHRLIREGWQRFGRGNAEAFAEQGWGFYTRESFDEYYPGYGPSWPIFTGAIGMTYEQASSEGGAIRRDDGTVLTLTEAARHHYTASRATLRTAATQRAQRLADYLTFRQDAARNALGGMRTILIGNDGQGRADSLVAVLLRHGIEVNRLEERRLRATAYGEDQNATVTIPAGSYAVDLAQPQGVLARTLLEPDPAMDPGFVREELQRRQDGLGDRFYDLTGWSLPFLYRVPAWHTTEAVDDAPPVPPLDTSGAGPTDTASVSASALEPATYAYLFEPGSEASIRMLAGLLADGIRVRYATRRVRTAGTDFRHGAFVVPVHRNRDRSLHDVMAAHAARTGARVLAVQTALAEDGTDLGSNTVRPIPIPKVALAGGDGISSSSFGAAWHTFDEVLRFPVTRVELDGLVRVLEDFNVVVLPSTWNPGSSLGDRGAEALRSWVQAGGTLITLGGSTRWITSQDGWVRLQARSSSDPIEDEPEAAQDLRASVPGAILRARVDTLSPLVTGVREAEIPVLVSGATVYDAPNDARPGEAAIRYADADRLHLAGYLWPELPERLAGGVHLWTESLGEGRIVAFAGDPTFRSMLRGMVPIFTNAVFLGGSY